MKSYLFTILFILASYCLPAQSFFTTVSGGCTADGPVELGMRFTTSQNATIKGLRFFKCGTGVYSLRLYSGNTLVTSVSSSQTANGWVTVTIPATSIIPGVTYTVSYYSPNGFYQAANPYSWPVRNGPLTATGSAYRYGGGYPNQTYQTSNYFADVVLQDSLPPVSGRDTIYIKDTVVLPCYPPDSSIIITNGNTIEKYYYFFDTVTKIETIRDTVYIRDTIRMTDTIVRTDTVQIDHYKTDTIYAECRDTSHVLIYWDGLDTVNYNLPHYDKFKVVEFTTFNGVRVRYRHYIKEAIKREEYDETLGQWIEK